MKRTSDIRGIITRPLMFAAMLATPLALNWGCDDGQSDDREPQAEQAPDAPEADAPEADVPEADPFEGMLRDGEEKLGEGVTKLAEVNVTGTRLMFLSVADPAVEEESLTLLEGGAAGGVSIGHEPALAGASLLDIFLAVSEPGVAIPSELLDQEDHALGERGWFAHKAARGEYKINRGVCVASDFQTELRNYEPTINGQEDWVLGTSPGGTGWYGPHGPSTGLSCPSCAIVWYDHNVNDGDWANSNRDANKQAVAICAVGSRPTVCGSGNVCIYDMGPTVAFWYRTPDDVLHSVWSRDIPAASEYWRMAWIGNASDANRDWRFRITDAVDADQFHMGYISEAHGW